MTEPVITINGRRLSEGQSMAVRVAISDMHLQMQDPDHLGKDEDARRLTYRDRLDEVLGMIVTAPPERVQQEKMLTGMHITRRNRILQLAGIVPEQATMNQIRLADGYAAAGLATDEAAVRLLRAEDVK